MKRPQRRSPRAGARRSVLRQLDAVREQLLTLRAWWTVRGMVYVAPEDRKPGENAYLRERELNEYPEAQVLYWRATVRETDVMIRSLIELRTYAFEQLALTEEEK